MVADIGLLQGKVIDHPERRIEEMPALLDQIRAEILRLNAPSAGEVHAKTDSDQVENSEGGHRERNP